MDWIDIARDKDGWQVLVHVVTKLRVPQNAANLKSPTCRAVNYLTMFTVTSAQPYKLQFIYIYMTLLLHVSVYTGHLHRVVTKEQQWLNMDRCAVIMLKYIWTVKCKLKCKVSRHLRMYVTCFQILRILMCL